MAQKTFGQLINIVLRNLREDQVTDLSANYTALIGDYINQAKELVEDSWQWHELRNDIDFDTVAGVREYDLSDAGVVTSSNGEWLVGRTFLLRDEYGGPMCWDVTPTDEMRMIEVPRSIGKNCISLGPDESQPEPTWFYLDIPNFVLVNLPEGVRNYKLQAYLPQDELTAFADTLTLGHWRAVTDYATAIAMEERGEELGPQSALYFTKADDSLAKAIAQDATHSPSEMTMTEDQLPYSGGWTGSGSRGGFF